MYDIAKTSAHGDESIAQLYKRLLSKQESLGSYLTNEAFTDETLSNILQETH
jgi:hypothetical protein